MEMEFVRHEPCYDRILFVLTLDRKKMKERILIGEELQVRFRLQGDMDADVLCDTTRPLGTFLAEFEHDPDGEWNRFGLAPLRDALHSNRWKQPALEAENIPNWAWSWRTALFRTPLPYTVRVSPSALPRP